jgi:tripartite-type tricarboxylate transporter receptor subunit TctC
MRSKDLRRTHLISLIALSLIAGNVSGQAQTWPTKPLKAVVPIAPGSITDIVPRIVFEQLSIQLGQPIVVENRPGAALTIGTAAVAKADPDGYTLLVNSSGHTIAPALHANLSYDPARDFAAVVPLGVVPSVLVVPPARGFKSLGEFVVAAKVRPDAMNFASAGVGTGTHLGSIRLQMSAGIRAVHVPFKSGPEALTEVIAGRLDFFLAPIGVALPHIKEGKLTALVVNTAKRAAALPDVPTVAEAGLTNAEFPFWLGVFLPAKTPRDIAEKLNREILKALQEPKVRDKLAGLGVEPMMMSTGEFDSYVAKEIGDNAALVKAAGLTPQ